MHLISLPSLLACRYRPESDQFVFCNGVALHRAQCALALGDQWLNSIVEFSRALHSMQLDISAFACLSALALVNGEWSVSRK